MYRYGNGVQQNDSIAFNYFVKAAQGGFSGGMYGAGYLFYTGQGVEQSYKEAKKWLKQGAEIGRPSCMYLLGLCYRNGYGGVKDVDKARDLMVKAAELGYVFAEDELYTPDAENKKSKYIAGLKGASSKANDPIKSGEKINKIKVQGQWQGTKTTYDFSGKHVLKEEPVLLNLTQNGKHITGIWTENDSIDIELEGTLADNVLYFIKGQAQRTDRYLRNRNWQMQQVKLEAVQHGDTLYFLCKLREYSPDIMELGQPISLLFQQRVSRDDSVISAKKEVEGLDVVIIEEFKDPDQVQIEEASVSINEDSNTDEIVKIQNFEQANKPDDKWQQAPVSLHIKIWPNPFVNQCTLEYTLSETSNVLLKIYSMKGMLVKNYKLGTKDVGKHEFVLDENLSPGTYLITLLAGKQKESLLVVKTN